MGLFTMAFTEDQNVFLNDFGVEVVISGVIFKGILEQPDEIVADGLVMTTDYQLTGKTSELGDLVFDNIITVAGDSYKVRSARKIDDGTFCIVSLNKE
tara:strand:- start:233 stop:526 length:294 start_codon:yes stop_codon:yes gene_type:complete